MSIKGIVKYLSTTDGMLVLLICMVWGRPLMNLIVAFFNRIPLLDVLSNSILSLIYLFVLLFSIKAFSRFLRRGDFVFFIFCLVVFLVHMDIYPQNSAMVEEYWKIFIFSALPCFFIGIVLDNKTLFSPLLVLSVLCLFLSLIMNVILMRTSVGSMKDNGVSEMMDAAYSTLPYVLFVISSLFKRFSIRTSMISVLGLLLILSFGTRGPLVCLLLFVLCCFIFVSKKDKRFIWVSSLIIVLTAIFVINLNTIAGYMAQQLGTAGFSTRIFDVILNESFTEQSGRDTIYTLVMDATYKSGFWGIGLGGSWNICGGYTHNLYADFASSFGLFLGTCLMIIIGLLIIRGFFSCDSTESKIMFFILFICGFVSLFFSGYFIGNKFFFMLLGYCVGRSRNNTLPSIPLLKTN